MSGLTWVVPSGLTVAPLDDEELGYPAWSVGIPHSNGQHYEDTICTCYDEAVADAIAKFPEFITFVEGIINDFETNHVLPNGKIVDNPRELDVTHYHAARKLLGYE